jgi:hypothetical protein
MSTIWVPVTINSTTYTNNVTDIEYDETGKTYDTLATYYDGNNLVYPVSTNWTQVAPGD